MQIEREKELILLHLGAQDFGAVLTALGSLFPLSAVGPQLRQAT